MTSRENLRPLLDFGLRPEPLRALKAAARLATASGVALYLVGGTVRDLLLGLHPNDFDLTVVGDAPALARAVAKAAGARWVEHDRFGTATVWLADGIQLDFVTARAETYVRPGALPTVRPGTLAEDLARRDFACNAIALQLDGDAWGTLVDELGGRDDIDAGRIRVLHDRSFIDDPTRIFRAVRYAGRLGFTLEARTYHLLHRDLARISTLTPDRIRHEVELILREPEPERILALAHHADLLRRLNPGLAFDETAAAALPIAMSMLPSEVEQAALGFALLGWNMETPDAVQLVPSLNLTQAETNALIGASEIRESESRLAAGGLSDSAATDLLAAFPLAAVVVFAASSNSPAARERALQYLDDWRHIRPSLNGRDLLALGVAAGPDLGALLRRLRAARIDGLAPTPEAERTLVQGWLQSAAGTATTECEAAPTEGGSSR